MTGPHCIATITGRVVDLAAPTPDMIDIEDIAHALANLCRYTGHVEHHYSVAQHSCLVHDWIAERRFGTETCFAGLMHDATEAYVGDMARPLKRMLPDYQAVEDRVWLAISRRYDAATSSATVRVADQFLYCWERRDVAHVPGIWDAPADLVLPVQIITPWPAVKAKAEFLDRFRRYR